MSVTITKVARLASAQKRVLIEATLSEVLAGNTSEETIDVGTIRGKVKDFHIVCDSDDYNISIRQKASVTPPSTDEIYDYDNIDLEYSFSDLSLTFFNMDTVQTENLYIAIDNTIGEDTGTISIKLVIEEG